LRGDKKPGFWPKTKSRGHIDVVLVDPQKSENIGAVARAISNMGLGNLILVRPRLSHPELMEAAATRLGTQTLKNAQTFGDLKEALAQHVLIVGTTARGGSHRGPFFSPRHIAPSIIELWPEPVALIFGTERMGLSTEDLRLCHNIIAIPTDSPEHSSLNLAQAVLILGYELLLASGGEYHKPKEIKPASGAKLIRAMEELEKTLIEIQFLPENNPGHFFMNIKKIFNRSLLTEGECDLILGICRQIRYFKNQGPN
jgi:tRNA/rRNA methyltransferase